MSSGKHMNKNVTGGARLFSRWYKKEGAVMRPLEIACFTMGCLLLAVYAAAQAHAAVGRWQAVEAFQVARGSSSSTASLPTDAPVDTSLWAEGRITAYRQSLALDVPPPGGLLRIPAIDLTVPIFEGTDDLNLNRGVGRIGGTATLGGPGNLGIAGHRDGFFRGLKDVKVGDVIEVETASETLVYRIARFKIVDPGDIEVLDDTAEPTLTLVTCYPFYFLGHAPQRYIVQAVRVDPASDLPI